MNDKSLKNLVKPGVATGDAVQLLFDAARKNQFAYPAVNVVGTNSINATLEPAHNMCIAWLKTTVYR